MTLPTKKSEDQSRLRAHAKAAGTYRDEPEEKYSPPMRLRRRPVPGELEDVLRDVPERLASRIKPD